MELSEIKPVLDQFTKSATEKIDAALDRVKKLEGENDELKNEVKSIVMKANRPNLGGDSGQVKQFTSAEMKSLDEGMRMLLKGNTEGAHRLFIEGKAMNAATGPDGGFLLTPQFSTDMTKVMAEISPMYRLARRIPIDPGHDSFEEPADVESADAVWTGEQTPRTETGTPGLKLFHLSLDEIYAMPKVTQKLIDVSSINIMDWLSGKVGDAFATKEGSAMHIGDGIAKARGILTYDIAPSADAVRAWGAVQYIPSGASGAFITPTATASPVDALIDMVTALKRQFRAGARWLMNRNTAGVIRKFKDADGRFVWVDSIVAGQPSTLLGYPVEEDEDMPDIAANSLSIAFGNMQRAYTIIEKPGIKFLPDPYTAKPHVLLYSYRRMSGGMHNSQAFKLMRFSAS